MVPEAGWYCLTMIGGAGRDEQSVSVMLTVGQVWASLLQDSTPMEPGATLLLDGKTPSSGQAILSSMALSIAFTTAPAACSADVTCVMVAADDRAIWSMTKERFTGGVSFREQYADGTILYVCIASMTMRCALPVPSAHGVTPMIVIADIAPAVMARHA